MNAHAVGRSMAFYFADLMVAEFVDMLNLGHLGLACKDLDLNLFAPYTLT
jgi:hypothetical protein